MPMPTPGGVPVLTTSPGVSVRKQTGNTNTMIFGVKKLVSYLSYMCTLTPGDVVSTGTPPGVGMGMKPSAQFLKSGDEMRVGIDGLGEQKQKVIGG